MKVKLLAREIELKKPASYAEAWDVASIGEKNQVRALAAALGICGVGRRLKIAYNGDAMTYGGKVIDALVAQGVEMGNIVEAGGQAFAMCAEMLVGGVEVKTAEDFTEAKGEDLTL